MTRPMRSWMFVPGNKPRFLEKASELEVDCVFLDLEDGVLPDDKKEARELVAETLQREVFRPLRFVRVNALTTAWHDDDLEAVVGKGLAGICLPKAESRGDVQKLAAALTRLEKERGLAEGTVAIIAAIESANALLEAPGIAKADPRVAALMFGAEDYALDLGLGTDRRGEAAEMLHARSSIVVAATAGRVLSIDGVFPNLDDPDGMVADTLKSRRLGFTAKSTFNPRHVEEINRIFSPQPGEIEYATRVVTAFEEARSRGDASVAVGGQLVDLPIVLRARRLLEQLEATS